jgi:hypothetical protein
LARTASGRADSLTASVRSRMLTAVTLVSGSTPVYVT